MILQETVLVTLHQKNIKYYESLGYLIPRYLDVNNKLTIKRKTQIKVKISDLLIGSQVKILCRCDNCGKENLVIFKNLKDKNGIYLCNYCAIFNEENNKQRSKRFIGKNNPNYNPKLSNDIRLLGQRRNINPQYYKWQQLVLNKDNYTCQCCGSIKKLQTHHINCWNEFPELRLNVDNGITLCFECHKAKNGKSIHNIYGRFPTKEQLNEFLKNYKII